MFKRSSLILVVIIFSTIGLVSADETLPTWQSGYWWKIQTHLDVHMEDPDSGDQVDMILDDDAPAYTCQGVETRTLTKGSGMTYNVYKLNFEGTISGTGTANISFTDLEIPLELRNGTEVGETWVDVNTLGTVFTSRFITGELWAYYLFSWQQVGTAEIALSEEYEPVRDLVNFPLTVGNSWSETMTHFTYGRYIVDYDLGAGPQHEEDTFESETAFNLDYTVPVIEKYKDWDTYRIEGTAPDWDGMLLARYTGEGLNMALVKMTDLDLPENGILIREMTQDLHGFSVSKGDGIQLHLNQTEFSEGDDFILLASLTNTGAARSVDEYILLDVYSNFWFWPEWTQTLSFMSRQMDSASSVNNESILEFVWPSVDSRANGLRFWAALLDTETQELFGEFDTVEWSYD